MTDLERHAEEVAHQWIVRHAPDRMWLASAWTKSMSHALLAFAHAEVERNLAELEDWLAANCAPWNHPSLSVTGLYSAVLNEIARRRASLKV